MQNRASTEFWRHYNSLPQNLRTRANKQFTLLKSDPQHPSLQFKKLGERLGNEVWSVRVTLGYRALAIKRVNGFLWFWIGDHKSYELLIR